MESNVFLLLPGYIIRYNLTKENWLAMKGLEEDQSIMIKPASKDVCVVVWDRRDYLLETKKHLSDNEIVKLVEKSNRMFERLFLKEMRFSRRMQVLLLQSQKGNQSRKIAFFA